MSELMAAIDIGSNTILLLIAELKEGNINAIYEEQRIPRLGKGVDESGNLHPESMQKALAALSYYRDIIENDYDGIANTIVTATSAVRDANNRAEFLNDIKHQTGFEVKLLSGHEEAQYTFEGALSMLETQNTNSLIIDIGGGSTELCYGNSNRVIDRHSFQMGSVRFTEKYLKAEVPSSVEIRDCRSVAQKLLENRALQIDEEAELVGVAGTLTSLAHIISGNGKYDSKLLNSMVLTMDGITEITNLFIEKGSAYFLQKYPIVMQGRSDVFLAGLLILEEVMKYYEFSELTVSTGGIRQGAILENLLK